MKVSFCDKCGKVIRGEIRILRIYDTSILAGECDGYEICKDCADSLKHTFEITRRNRRKVIENDSASTI